MSSCCLHTLKSRMTAPFAFVYSYRYSYSFVLSSHCWFLRFPKRALNLSVTYACSNTQISPSSRHRIRRAPYLIPSGLEALPGEQVVEVLRKPRVLALLVRQCFEYLRTLTLGVTPKVVRERDASTREERGDGDVRCRVLATIKSPPGAESQLMGLTSRSRSILTRT